MLKDPDGTRMRPVVSLNDIIIQKKRLFFFSPAEVRKNRFSATTVVYGSLVEYVRSELSRFALSLTWTFLFLIERFLWRHATVAETAAKKLRWSTTTTYSLPHFGPFHSSQDNTSSIIVQGKPIRLLDWRLMMFL